MAFIGLHIVTTVSDTYAPIGWLAVFVPFTSPYRRLWLGLGTVACVLGSRIVSNAVLEASRERLPRVAPITVARDAR